MRAIEHVITQLPRPPRAEKTVLTTYVGVQRFELVKKPCGYVVRTRMRDSAMAYESDLFRLYEPALRSFWAAVKVEAYIEDKEGASDDQAN